MSARLDNVRVRRAIQQLAKYFGLSELGADYYKSFPDVQKSEQTAAFFHNGTTYPIVEALLSLTNENVNNSFNDDAGSEDVVTRVCVTPYEARQLQAGDNNGDALWAYIHKGWNVEAGQGWRQPTDTMQPSFRNDVLPPDKKESYEKEKNEKDDSSVSKREVPVHVLQVYDPVYTPSATDVDVSTFLMNGVPTLEWSRCVPYFEIIIMDAGATKKSVHGGAALDKFVGPMSSIRFAKFESELGDIDPNMSIAGAMELFTQPQTMLAGNPQLLNAQGGKPFAPLISATEFSVTQTGIQPQGKQNTVAGAPAVSEKVSLRLLLHDKARLNEVIGYFRPGATGDGSTSLAISYGWSHPDGSRIENVGAASEIILGEILNACRTTSVYKVSDVRYNFTEAGEVQLDLELSVSANNAIFKHANLIAGAASTSTDLSAVINDTIDFIELLEGTGGRSTSIGLGKKFMKSLKDELTTEPDVERKLKAFKAKIKSSGFGIKRRRVLSGHRADHTFTTYGENPAFSDTYYPPGEAFGQAVADYELGETNFNSVYQDANIVADSSDFSHLVGEVDGIEAIYDTKNVNDPTLDGFGELAAIFSSIFKKGTTKNLSDAAVKSNAKKVIGKLIDQVGSGHDPFLRPRPAEFPNKGSVSCYSFDTFDKESDRGSSKSGNQWVSLGKLVGFFLSPTLQASDGIQECQIVFYPFNYDAAGLWNHNIGSFPIPIKDLKKKLISIVEQRGNISLRDFLSFVFDNYINDNTLSHSPAYGLKGVKDKDKTVRLKKIYGDTETHAKATPDVRLPRVQFRIGEKPMRRSLFESQIASNSQSQKIVRVEIFDEGCSANPFIRDIQETNGAGMLKKVRKENRSKYGARVDLMGQNRHQYYYQAAVEHFKSKGFISEKGSDEDTLKSFVDAINKKITNKKEEIDPKEFKKMIESYYFIGSPEAMNDPSLNASAVLGHEIQEGGTKGNVRAEMRKTSQGYILHGNEGTAVTKITVQTSQDKAAKDLLLLSTQEPAQRKEDDKNSIGRIPIQMIPGEIDIECFGNPFLQRGQEYFVHLGTHTNLDGLYVVNETTHTITPGEFLTSVKMVNPSASSPRYVNAQRELFNFVASQLSKGLK